jgi:hypothetical protein
MCISHASRHYSTMVGLLQLKTALFLRFWSCQQQRAMKGAEELLGDTCWALYT